MIIITVIVLTDFIFGGSNVGVLGNVGQIRACNNKCKSQYKSVLIWTRLLVCVSHQD